MRQFFFFFFFCSNVISSQQKWFHFFGSFRFLFYFYPFGAHLICNELILTTTTTLRVHRKYLKLESSTNWTTKRQTYLNLNKWRQNYVAPAPVGTSSSSWCFYTLFFLLLLLLLFISLEFNLYLLKCSTKTILFLLHTFTCSVFYFQNIYALFVLSLFFVLFITIWSSASAVAAAVVVYFVVNLLLKCCVYNK